MLLLNHYSSGMLSDQKIDLWYAPGWIKQSSSKFKTTKHPDPSNKNLNAVQTSDCLEEAQHLYLLKEIKIKAKAIQHHCAYSSYTTDRNDLVKPEQERWNGLTNKAAWCTEGHTLVVHWQALQELPTHWILAPCVLGFCVKFLLAGGL